MTINQDSEFDILAAYKKMNFIIQSIFLNDHKTWNQKFTLSEYSIDQLRGSHKQPQAIVLTFQVEMENLDSDGRTLKLLLLICDTALL